MKKIIIPDILYMAIVFLVTTFVFGSLLISIFKTKDYNDLYWVCLFVVPIIILYVIYFARFEIITLYEDKIVLTTIKRKQTIYYKEVINVTCINGYYFSYKSYEIKTWDDTMIIPKNKITEKILTSHIHI